MATPLFVVKGLAEVRESGNVNMRNKKGVTLFAPPRVADWISDASDSEFMQALNDMGAYVSDGEDLFEGLNESDTDESEDENSGNYSY